jgi:hypothetical protein
MSGFIEEIITKLEALPPDQLADLKKKMALAKAVEKRTWTPNSGAQTLAYESQADELFYGGAAGGGKSALLCGVAVNNHRVAHIFRRESVQVRGLVEELTKILGTSEGLNRQSGVWRMPTGQIIELGGVKDPQDVESWQGRAADLKGFDEITAFSEQQYRFLITWNRSTDPGQRCRVIATGNPPVTEGGLWVVSYWGAWLDPLHPNPAQPGELRWYTTIEGQDQELPGPEPVMLRGELITPRSRTFIPAKLEDNPDLKRAGYASMLEALPEELRIRFREGKFTTSFADDDFQVIPTAWVMAAQERWTAKRPDDVMMTAIGVDIAQGGADRTVLAPRYGAWFAPLIVYPGDKTPDGPTAAALIISHMRDGAQINLDIGGGWGGSARDFLKDNDLVSLLSVNPANASTSRALGSGLAFRNKRAELWWRMREGLDPSNEEKLALPPDRELRAELCAPRWRNTAGGILIEDKLDIRRRLGRSPDKGDAATLAWYSGSLRQKKQRSALNLPKMTNEDRRYDRRLGVPGSGYSRSGRGHRQETNGGGWKGGSGYDDQA